MVINEVRRGLKLAPVAWMIHSFNGLLQWPVGGPSWAVASSSGLVDLPGKWGIIDMVRRECRSCSSCLQVRRKLSKVPLRRCYGCHFGVRRGLKQAPVASMIFPFNGWLQWPVGGRRGLLQAPVASMIYPVNGVSSTGSVVSAYLAPVPSRSVASCQKSHYMLFIPSGL